MAVGGFVRCVCECSAVGARPRFFISGLNSKPAGTFSFDDLQKDSVEPAVHVVW